MPKRHDWESLQRKVRELRAPPHSMSYENVATKLGISKPTALKADKGTWKKETATPAAEPQKETAPPPAKDEGEELHLREPEPKRKPAPKPKPAEATKEPEVKHRVFVI